MADTSEKVGAGVFVIATVALVFWGFAGPYLHGATPADLANVTLTGTPAQLGKALPASDVDKHSVRVDFLVQSARPYKYADFGWSSDAPSAPSTMSLVAEHSDHDDTGDKLHAKLAARFHAMRGTEWRWGRVTFDVTPSTGAIGFRVEPMIHGSELNPDFERQVDVARQVILEAAFGIPLRATDAELRELLGAPYPIADVGMIDPQMPLELVADDTHERFPGALHETSDTWEISVDHPLLRSVELRWSNRMNGRMAAATLDVSDAYEASRDLLQSCLATRVGDPATKTTDYAAGKKKYAFAIGSITMTLDESGISLGARASWDTSAWSQLFAALSSCKDKSENTGARGDARKK